MFLLDSLLVGGLRFVLDKVVAVAEQELDSVESLNRALVDAQLQLEEGTITDEEFAQTEGSVMARLRELKRAEPGGLADANSFDGIEVTVDDDGHS
jgi:hypothetical protein